MFNEISFVLFNKTALVIAIENGNLEIVQLLLQCEGIDVNSKLISKTIIFI